MEKKAGFLKKSLNFLQKNQPILAHQLTTTDPTDLTFCLTQQKEINLTRLYQNHRYYYHSHIDARKEAQEWFKGLHLKEETIIFIYGIGLGYYYEAARSWLKQNPDSRLVFLEEDLNVLYRLCETALGFQLLKDPQIQLIYCQDLLTQSALFHELAWTYLNNSFLISCLKLYEQVNPEGYFQLHHQLSYYLIKKKDFVEEYLQYGLVFFRNFYMNLLELPKAYWGNGLFNRFQKIPAIICGAGPSLNRNIHLLSSLKDRALLFAGGSALHALIPHGILPHFGVAIDPNVEQYSRLVSFEHLSIPFFYRHRLFYQALKVINGPRLYLTGSGGHRTAQWFDTQLNIAGEDLDEGHNVVNFSLQIAQALGCNPLILVGVDLACTEEQFYMKGIANSLGLTEEKLKEKETDNLALISRKDIYGKPIKTLWKWITEAEWISEFAKQHPEVTIFNATEGGLGFKGILNLSLEEVSQQFLINPQSQIQQINQEIQKHSLKHLKINHIVELIQKMKGSIDHCICLLSKLIDSQDELIQQITHNQPYPLDLNTIAMSILESDMEQEIGYVYLLEIFEKIFIHLQHRNQQDLLSPKQCLSKQKQALRQLELKKQRLIFLRDVAQCNSSLIRFILLTHLTHKE